MLATGGQSGAQLRAVAIRFVDGTEELRDVPCPDWFTERIQEREGVLCTLVRNGMDRLSDGKFEDANEAALFDALLPIKSDQELVRLTLHPASATFTNDGTRFNLFAVTGMTARDIASE